MCIFTNTTLCSNGTTLQICKLPFSLFPLKLPRHNTKIADTAKLQALRDTVTDCELGSGDSTRSGKLCKKYINGDYFCEYFEELSCLQRNVAPHIVVFTFDPKRNVVHESFN